MKKILLAAVGCLLAMSAFAVTVGTNQNESGPWDTEVFVRGGFNDWGTTDAMTWDEVNQQFDAVVSIDAGTWEFKIADATWANPDFGPTGDQNVTLGVPTDIGTAIGSNFVLVLEQSGDYLFRLFNIAEDLQSGNLLVQVIPIPGALLLFASALGLLGWLKRRAL